MPSSHSYARQTLGELFALSFLVLFLELALIRYLGATIWNLGYFPNFVLLSAFNGAGLGFLFHGRLSERASQAALIASAWLLLGLFALVAYWHPAVPALSTLGGELGGELFFSGAPAVNRLQTAVAFPLVFALLALIFALLGQGMAKRFRAARPLVSYSVNIGGSCAGVLGFAIVSWREWPALLWFILLIPLYLLVLGRRASAALAALLGCLYFVHAANGAGEVIWSPYQKVQYIEEKNAGTVFVNGINHQSIQSLENMKRTWYGLPYLDPEGGGEAGIHPVPRKVLVLGSGTGNDVAAALALGVQRVDAVEIDPAIARLGREHHPAHPYQSRQVRLFLEDGRNFLNRSTESYDLILFALTDSLVRASPISQLRLENYLFTREAVQSAARRLAPGGKILFYNFYRQEWLAAKIARMLEEATGAPARIIPFGGFRVIVAKPGAGLRSPLSSHGIETPTDDWPFLYLRERGFPPLYRGALLALAGLLGALLLALRRQPGAASPAALSFFFLGLAFCLLETKSIIQFSLLFGTSWWNNSFVILGILALVLVANAAAARFPASRIPLITFALLFACFAGWWVPPSLLLAIPSGTLRFITAALFLFSPVFFANLLFSLLFRDSATAETMLGWNLLGSAFGGIVEYSSMALGYRSLSLVIAACYCAALLCALRGRKLYPSLTNAALSWS